MLERLVKKERCKRRRNLQESAPSIFLQQLDKVANVVKIQAFVSNEVDLMQQYTVVNAASQLLYDIFGEAGQHAWTAERQCFPDR